MNWFRSYHGAPTDPKWQVIARRANTTPSIVVAVFWALLDHASQQEDRGSIEGFDSESISMFLDIDESDIERIIAAMESKNVVSEMRLANWDKRQPEDTSTLRVQRYRARQRESKATETERNVTETLRSVTETHCNVEQREQNRTEKSRAEQRQPSRFRDEVADPFTGTDTKTEAENKRIAACLLLNPEWELEARRRSEGKQNPEAYTKKLLLGWESGEYTPPLKGNNSPPNTPPPPSIRIPPRLPQVYADAQPEGVGLVEWRQAVYGCQERMNAAGDFGEGGYDRNVHAPIVIDAARLRCGLPPVAEDNHTAAQNNYTSAQEAA